MMKKSTVLLLILTILMGAFSFASAAVSDDIMASFDIMPPGCNSDSNKLVTRAEFAYTIANILGSGEVKPRATAYDDVIEEDAMSGYIYHATVNGFLLPTGTLFCPNDPISFHDFNAAVVKLLAYERIAQANGGGEAGNLKTVMDLNLYKGVSTDSYDTVTVKQYRRLVYNLLTAKVSDFTYSYDGDGNVSLTKTNATKTILSEYFNISRYYGKITEVNNEAQTVKVQIEKNVSSSNPTMLAEGGSYSFRSNGKLDLNFYANIPIELWGTEDGDIVYIAPRENVEVFYDVIYSVNNDTNANAYAISLVSKMELKRDEKVYKVDSAAQVKYNGTVTNAPVVLAGKYAKIVMIDDKITFVETWNLQEGGLITEVNNSFIEYQQGETASRLKNLPDYEDIIVIIEGRSTDRGQIKPNSLFSYYKTSDLLVIAVSEKALVGSLDSTADTEIEIGRYSYPVSGNVYVSEDGSSFQTANHNAPGYNKVYEKIFGTRITAYFDIFGNIKYIKPGDQLRTDNEFTAYVIGYSKKGFDDYQLKLMKIDPVIEEVTVTLPADFPASKYVDNPATTGYTVANLQANLLRPLTWDDRMAPYEKLYKFTLNTKNEIIRIAEPDYFLLFGEAHNVEYLDSSKNVQVQAVPCVPAIDVPLDHFTGDYRAIYMPVTKVNGIDVGLGTSLASSDLFYIRNERFLVMSNVGGKMKIEESTYDKLHAHGTFSFAAGMNVNIVMLAAPGSSQPDLWLLYGNTDKIYTYNGGDDAVINKITRMYDAETDDVYYQIMLDNNKLEWKLNTLEFDPSWIITSNRADLTVPTQLEVGMEVKYKKGALFCDNEVAITEIVEYPKTADGSDMTMDEWYKNVAPGLLRGTFKKITASRLYLENGGMYHIGNNCYVTGVRFRNGQVIYEDIDALNIEPGATVYFNRTMNVNSIYVELTD